MIERRPNETDFEYHKRLVYGKLIDKTLADIDYTELSPLVYGQEYSADVARRMMYGSCKTLQALDAAHISTASSDSLVNELEQKRIELQKERQRFFDQRVAYNKVVRERARQEELNEIIERCISESKSPELVSACIDYEDSGNDLLVSLNDIHYGANYENYWGTYNSDVCAKMMSKYIEEIIKIRNTHNSQNCFVWANGDLISGSIHKSIQIANRENIIEQVIGVSELIANFLYILSGCFKNVFFTSVSGNHSRVDSKEDSLRQERLDDLVEWYLSARMAKCENVHVGYGVKIDCSMYVIDVRGKNYIGVHGDYDSSPAQIQALQTFARRPVYAVLLGHKHHNETNIVQGIRTIMAGSFLGMDDYCLTKRLYCKPEQMVSVCDESGIRCNYNVDISV